MEISVLLLSVLVPCLLGAALCVAAASTSLIDRMVPVILVLAILGIYIFYEGVPPVSPISSKQKLSFILLAVSVLAALSPLLPSRRHGLIAGLLLLPGFGWLVQRRLMRGDIQLEWLIPVLTIIVLVWAISHAPAQRLNRFAWPVTLLSLAVTASLVALLGGILGVGQVLISVAALFGGLTLALYVLALRGSDWRPIAGAFESALIALGVLLIQMATFATNLSLPGYAGVLALISLPLASRVIASHATWRQPFLFAGLALLVSGPAILMAVWNFHTV